jgi:hypothetical protein
VESFSVIRAAAFRALRPWLFEKIFPLELATAVKQKYEFIKAPDASQLNQPADFQIGKFRHGDKVTTIEQFVVTYVGNKATSLGAATRESSDESEEFLEDVIEWAARQYGLDTNEVLPRAYFSQVEFVLPKPLGQHFAELQEIGTTITNFIRRYGLEYCPMYEFGGFSMHFDVVKFDDLKPNPQAFAIERRVGSRYEENKYFSQAPLRTQDHRAIVERLEELLMR